MEGIGWKNNPGITTFSPWLSILGAAGLGDGAGLGIPWFWLVQSPAGSSCPPARGPSSEQEAVAAGS